MAKRSSSSSMVGSSAASGPASLLLALVLFHLSHLEPRGQALGQLIRLRRPLLRERLQNIFATSENDRRPQAAQQAVALPAALPVEPEPRARANNSTQVARQLPATSTTTSSTPRPPGKPSPRPGNIVVHLGADQEIERLEYMLRDGRLATVYSRHHDEPEKRQELHYPPGGALGLPKGAGELLSLPEPPRPMVLPPFRGEPIDFNPLLGTTTGGDGPSVALSELEDEDHPNANAGQAEIIAHVAQQQAALPNPKPGKVKGLIKKIKSKLKGLPKTLGKKLAAKSTIGKMFVDTAAGMRIPVAPLQFDRVLSGTHTGQNQNSHHPPPVPPASGPGAIVQPPGALWQDSNVLQLGEGPRSPPTDANFPPGPAGFSRQELRSE